MQQEKIFQNTENHHIRIIICEDILEQLSIQSDTVRLAAKKNGWQCEISVFSNPLLLLNAFEEEYQNASKKDFDILVVLADIRMPQIDGIELCKRLHELSPDAYLIFTTAYEEYAIKGYEANAFRYLLKPVNVEKLEQVLFEIIHLEAGKHSLMIRDNGKERSIPLNDILYLSAEDKYVLLFTVKEKYFSRKSLQDYEEMLSAYGFFRIHRKYLVNMFHHKELSAGHVLLSNGSTLPLSKRRENAYRKSIYGMLKGGLLR